MPAAKHPKQPKPSKNKTGAPREVPPDVEKRQLGDYSTEQFEQALQKATRRVDPSPLDPESSKR